MCKITKRDLLAVEKGGLNRSVVTVANFCSDSQCRDLHSRGGSDDAAIQIGCVPIVDHLGDTGKLVGIVTESGFVRAHDHAM